MRNAFLALAFTFALVNGPVSAQVPIPNTISGQVLEAWIDAFNSAERERIQAFVDQYGWTQPVNSILSFRTTTGGFDLLSVERTEPRTIEFLVKERSSDTRAWGRLALSGNPPRESQGTISAIP